MKDASAAMIAHVAQSLTTLTTCLKITRTDDVVLAFTALDQPFTFETVLHKIGYDPTAVVSSDAMNVDNLEWQGVVDHADITSEDIRAGKYDDAAFEIYRVNWTDLTQGKITLKTGTIGNISLNYPGEFVAEGRSLMQSLQVKIGMHFTPHCKWDLGDHRCKFNLVGQIGEVDEESPDPAVAIPFWQANHAYVVGDLVSPTVPNGFSYICVDPGTSGATEPDWDAAENASAAGTQSYLTDPGITDNKAYIVTPAETGGYVLQGPVGEVGSGRWAFLQDGIGVTHQIAHTTQTGSIPNDGAWTTNNDIHSASITASVSGGKTSYQLALSTVDDAVYACGEVDLLLLAVTSLSVAAGATQITLTWEDAAANETGFKIERSLNVNTGYVQIATVGANVLTYLDTGLQAGTTYYYRVRSTNANGDSTYSNTASHTTDAALQINEPGVLSFSQQQFIGALTTLTLAWKSGVNSASHGGRCGGGLDAAIAMISVYFKNTVNDQTLQYQIYTYDSRAFAPDGFWFNSAGPLFFGVADNITRYSGVYSPLGAAPQSFTAEILARVIALMAACPNPALDEDPDHWKILMMSVGPFVNGEAIINCTVSDVGMVAGTLAAPVPGIIDGGVIWEKSAPTPAPPGPPVPPPIPPGPDAPAPGSYVTPATVATVIDEHWEFTATTTGTQLQLNSTVPVPYWQSKHMYWVGDSVRPTDTDITLRAVCNTLVWDEKKKTQDVPSGTSGDDEPDWPTVVGERIEDNELEWVMVEDQWYKDGVLRFTSGDNAGLAKQFEVLLYEVTGTSARFRLVLPTPYSIQVGDAFLVEAGCDKSHMTCIYKFNNILNFGGEPHVAGFNRPHDTPTDSSLE